MKKVVSVFVLAILVSPYTAPVFAQKRSSGLVGSDGVRKVATNVSKISPLPGSTQFKTIGAFTDGNGVYLAWDMDAEVGNIGFNVYRVGDHGAELVNSKNFVLGAATHGREAPSFGESYNFFDPSGQNVSGYYVEAVSLSGKNVVSRQIYPQYVSDLKPISGKSSDDLARQLENAKSDVDHTSLTLSKELINEIDQTSHLADPVNHKFVISQQGVVRIGIKGEGIFRVTRTDLEAAGFNVNSDPAFWQLYREGVQQSIIVGGNGDYIEFYGKGLDLPETEVRVFYLMNGASAGKRIQSRVARRGTSSVVSPGYSQTYVKKERINYVDDVDNGDIENYFGRAVASAFQTVTFNLSGVDRTKSTATIFIQWMGYSDFEHMIEMSLNDQPLPVYNPIPPVSGEGYINVQYTIPTSLLIDGANNLKFRAFGPSDFVFFDQFHISFDRKYLAEQNKLNFYTQNYRAAKLDGFSSSNVRVFDTTVEGDPVLMTNLTFTQNGGTFGTEMPQSRGRVFFASEDSATQSAVSVTPNNPELVADSAGAQLVIISYKDFMPQAQTWANYRIGQGFSVKVIEVSELYDEFNYGTLGAIGIKNFLQHAYQNWSVQPKYVLLLGDASVDSRNYQNTGFWNLVPSKQVGAVFTETASDEALADFDNDGLSEIAIGRIASRDAAGITTVYNKVVAWETAVPTLDRGALFAYDFNDGYDFDGMSLRIRNQLPMSMPATMVFRGEANANTNLLNSMNSGKFIVNYAGHGTTGSWGGNPVFFNVFSIPNLTEDANNPAIFTMLTCLNGGFHYLNNESFAEALTKAPNKGAVAAWASTGLTLANVQEVMALRFYQKVGEGTIPRLGDLVKDAKTTLTIEIGGGVDVRHSWALVGDPMLKVR